MSPSARNPGIMACSPLPLPVQGAAVHVDYLALCCGLSGEAAVRRAQYSVTVCAKGSLFPGRKERSTKSVFLGLLSQLAAEVGM